MPGKRKKGFKSNYRKGSSSILTSIYRQRIPGQTRPQPLSQCGTRSGSIFSNTAYAFDDSNSDATDTDAESETDFVNRKPLEIELSEQAKENFEELDGKFSSTRYEQSRVFYDNDENEYSRVLQEDNMQYGLELSNEDEFQDRKEKETFYERMLSKEILNDTLKKDPHRFKRCKFTVQNAHESTCKVLDVPDIDGLDEIKISGRSKAGRTFDGDIVLVEIYNQKKYTTQFIGRNKREVNRNNKLHKVYGKVVGIFERNMAENIKHPVFMCVLDDTSNFLMRPVCKTVPKLNIIHNFKYPYHILVHKYDPNSARLSFHDRFRIDPKVIKSFTFQVVFIRWTEFYPYPLAAVIKVIKTEETPSSALQNLRLQHHVPKYYRNNTVIETERTVNRLNLAEVENGKDREDLTGLKVFTIDSVASKDLDDALSIEKADNENYRIGVHIADVGAVILKNDAIDLEAQERTCTYYPGQGIKPYHMLPEPFSTDICSLIPDVARPAITVLFTIDDEFKIDDIKVKKTTIKSVKRFTYEEVQNIIDDDSSVGELGERILLLFKFAKSLRRKRLKDAMFAFPVETKLNDPTNSVLSSREAHYLVEEFMIIANRCVAQYLSRVFPDVIPLCCQEAPSEEMVNGWIEQNSPILNMVLKLQDVKLTNEYKIGLNQIQNQIKFEDVLPFQKWVWESLSESTKENDMKLAARMIGTDELHPLQCLALEEWTSFQETTVYKCSGKCKREEMIHFSLDMDLYVHFTSPIRRYPDLIINRLIHAALESKQCPYLPEEVHDLCERFNSTILRANNFKKQCQLMTWGFQLKKTPHIVHGFVKEFTEKSVSIIIPGLRNLPMYCKDIPLNLLHLSEKPTISNVLEDKEEVMMLKWSQRLYDVTRKPVTSVVLSEPIAREAVCKQINPHTKARFVMQETWKTILKMIVEENISGLKQFFTETHIDDNFGLDEDKHDFVDACKNTVLDHSSEVDNGNIIKQGCEYSLSFSRGQIVTVQLSAEPEKAILSPSMQLFDMTRSIKHCLQHTRDLIKFLSDYSFLKPWKIYYSPSIYLSIWLPLYEMEAVTSAVDEDSITINNVSVEFEDKRHGHFYLSRRFCDQRDIDFSTMTDEFIIVGEDLDQPEFLNSSFICLKSEHVYKKTSKAREKVPLDPDDRSNWILHGQVTVVEKIKQRAKYETMEQNPGQRKSTKIRFKIKFKLHDGSSDPCSGMLSKENPSTCSVEIIPKSETDVRIEAILKCLDQSTELARKIALNKGKWNHLDSRYSKIAKEMRVEVNTSNIVLNNEYQRNAIKKALKSTFTLIHGPPGTGKTYTGTKLVYIFNEINNRMQTEGHAKKQLVFCGPNNKSVDLVARWMYQKYGNDCPDIVRIYGNSLENKDFPTLGKYFSKRASAREAKPDPQLKDISVHRLIRLENKPFAEEIRKFDEKFRKYNEGQYEPTLEDLKKYRKITSQASQEELKQHSVIFCTTAVATSPRFIKALTERVQQLVIDEAGMCTEPESIAAIIASKAEQVVLIGDHKQLQPVLKSTFAAKLGLRKSLFERYCDRAMMLQIQYRMHPAICEFPSKEFYDGKLLTKSSPKWDISNPLKIWINRDKKPIVFCHVEGEEEYLTVSAEEGNEQSCSNKQEVDKVVKILKHLVEHERLDLSDEENLNIMSQYNAQCHQIRLAVSNIAEKVNVNTVVASQGGEWNYVIFSTVRSLPRYRIEKRPTLGWCAKSLGFISDAHQINVALTRARRGLIIIGNKYLLASNPVWKRLIEHYASLGCVVDEDEEFPRSP
ncbi:3'-5' exoribonuclease HELZ2 [Magallana gigas]|uniref:3'-5' exoribonuclease HELZ2 n=1 Tax=Magallana gigas TaxID=29159 RepID=UPI0033401632